MQVPSLLKSTPVTGSLWAGNVDTQSSAAHVPQLHRFVEASAHQQVGLGVEIKREDEVGMTPEFDQGVAGG
eukprot:CAMPEP_0195525348 /NCGR_PEP_ID=MMETSP0794_2-20130614/25769_1 /TAXON_ID=515487 /ORGANISM="Stephanopyxis turris, Strain CCMP 815" /LENGTH=70 /DNA_ID=CAMNT_0040655799 /DNA_START=75 /DNA_END=282 /DNA_ORIENTATION=-